MNTLKSKISVALLFFLITLTFASCDDYDDYWARDNFIGTWRVAEVTPINDGYGYYGDYGSYYNPPYRSGDIMQFNADGTFYVIGIDGMQEYGIWDVNRGYLNMDFNGSSYLSGLIRESTSYDYIKLDVNDSYYGSYSLRLTRQSY